MGFGAMLKEAKYPGGDGFPFGSYQIQLLELKSIKEKGQKGEWKDYFVWKLQVIAKRHESAQAGEGAIVLLKRDVATDFGLADNKMLAQSFTSQSRDEFDAISPEEIDAYLASLTEAGCKAKVRQCVLEVTPDAKGYRRYHSYRVVDAPPAPFVFDPANVPTRQASTTETAASEAGKGTPAAPPARSSL